MWFLPSGFLATLAVVDLLRPRRPYLYEMPARKALCEAGGRAVVSAGLAGLVLYGAGGWVNPFGNLVAAMMLFAAGWNGLWCLFLIPLTFESRAKSSGRP
jgi:hypothetical protein